MYEIRIELLNGERCIEYAKDEAEMAAKADEYGGRFVLFQAKPTQLKDMRQGKEKANDTL